MTDGCAESHRGLRTAEVATASGYSVQQVRDLERLGVLPPVARTPGGHRRLGPVHVLALHAYRGLAAAVGPVTARRVLREVQVLPVDEAVALVTTLHTTLADERAQALAALRALEVIRAEAEIATPDPPGRSEERGAPPDDDTTMTIRELATALGVRASTLRFWEEAGLVRPERVTARAARRYPPDAVREARIAAALRAAGYGVPEVLRTVEAIRGLHGLDEARGVLRTRLEAIAGRALALLRAGTAITELIGASTEPTVGGTSGATTP